MIVIYFLLLSLLILSLCLLFIFSYERSEGFMAWNIDDDGKFKNPISGHSATTFFFEDPLR